MKPEHERAREIGERLGKMDGCQCVCHRFPEHGKLQDALEALEWHQKQIFARQAEHICAFCVEVEKRAQDRQITLHWSFEELKSELLGERAELGIDGNCGFALLGENIQEGEAEFVEIGEAELGRELDAQLIACKQALEKLRKRLGLQQMNYYFGRSHPYGR